MSLSSTLSDFWWLDEALLSQYSLITLCYIPPINEDTSSIEQHIEKHTISEIDNYRKRFSNINVHRSLKLYNQNDRLVIIGPFVIDIDNENILNASQEITKQILNYFDSKNIHENDLRIFFTGHKGFNIEVNPKVLNINGTIDEQFRVINETRKIVIDILRKQNNVKSQCRNYVDNQETVIDIIHEYTRLHDSINRWVDCNGQIMFRKKIELTCNDILSKSTNEILTLANI